jgi:hypothetical protein
VCTVAPASAGRRLEARGVEPLFPACYVWMLLVSLLGAKRLETCVIGLLARPSHSGALDW